MAHVVKRLSGSARARQKQISRDRDARRLNAGDVNRRELQAENSFFSGLNIADFRIAAIGGRSVESLR